MLGERKVGEIRQMGNRVFIHRAHCIFSWSYYARTEGAG